MTAGATQGGVATYRAAWVHPVSTPSIRDGAVAVRGDRIAWVGAYANLPPEFGGTVEDLGATVLTPGLVNAHTHLDLTAARGVLDGLTFFEWIRGVVALRNQLDAAQTYDSAALGAIESLEAGVTTVADTSPTAASARAMSAFGLGGIAYLEVFGPDPATAPAAVADARARIAAVRDEMPASITIGISPHAPYSVSDDLFRAVAAFAREEAVPLATHVAESAAESDLVGHATGPFTAFLISRAIPVMRRASSPVALLEQCGVLAPNALLIHCVRCNAADVSRVATSGAAVATCPSSNRYFRHGDAPVGAFRAAGVRVGIGTDSVASGASLSPASEANGAPGACGGDAWRAVTLDGAHALGLGERIGVLAAGRRADLAAFPLAGEAPFDAAAPLPSRATFVVTGGAVRLRDGRVLAPDTEGIRARCAAASARLGEWRRARTPA